MPGGKTATRGAVGSHDRRLINRLDLATLIAKKRRGYATPSSVDLEILTTTFRHALAFYYVAAWGRRPPTATYQRKELERVRNAARILLLEPNAPDRREKQLKALNCNPHTRDVIHRHLRGTIDGTLRHDRSDLVALELGINDKIETDREFDQQELRAIKLLAEMHVRKLSARTIWSDPDLTRLVFDLVPIWRQATGRSAAQKNSAGDKAYHFSRWVRGLLAELGLKPVPENTISRIVGIFLQGTKAGGKVRQNRSPRSAK